MIQLGLTQKIQKAAGIKPVNLCKIEDQDIGLGNWTVNLFNQERRKNVIFLNDKTLYSFVLTGARKEHYANLSEIFCRGLNQLLKIDGFTESQISYLTAGLDDIRFTKTQSKSVLGSLNDLVWHYQFHISDQGGLQFADVGEIIHRLNRMPQNNLEWAYSINAVQEIAKNA